MIPLVPPPAATRTGMDSPVAGRSDAAKRRASGAVAASAVMTVFAVNVNCPRPTVRLSGRGMIATLGAVASCARAGIVTHASNAAENSVRVIMRYWWSGMESSRAQLFIPGRRGSRSDR